MLTNFISWHWVFFVNVPFVLLILGLSRFMVPEDRRVVGARSYDLAGALTVTEGLLLLVYAIIRKPTRAVRLHLRQGDCSL